MSDKLIDFLVPDLQQATDVVYDQLDELRELYAASRNDPANPSVTAMLEAVISWAEQTEG